MAAHQELRERLGVKPVVELQHQASDDLRDPKLLEREPPFEEVDEQREPRLEKLPATEK